MSLHGEPVKRQQWCIPCPDTTVALKYKLFHVIPTVSFSHFLRFAPHKIHTYTHAIPNFETSHQWFLTCGNIQGQNLSFVLEKLLESKRHVAIKPTQKSAQKKQGPIQPVKTTEPRSFQMDFQLQKQDHVWIPLCAFLRIQILTKKNEISLLFKS